MLRAQLERSCVTYFLCANQDLAPKSHCACRVVCGDKSHLIKLSPPHRPGGADFTCSVVDLYHDVHNTYIMSVTLTRIYIIHTRSLCNCYIFMYSRKYQYSSFCLFSRGERRQRQPHHCFPRVPCIWRDHGQRVSQCPDLLN